MTRVKRTITPKACAAARDAVRAAGKRGLRPGDLGLAVANSLAQQVAKVRGDTERGRSFFLNIKGPELLNKFVGETERHIRLIF